MANTIKFEKRGFMVPHPLGHKKEGWAPFTTKWGPYANRALKGGK